MYFIESQTLQTQEREQIIQQAQALESKMNELLKVRELDASKMEELRTTNDQLSAANNRLRQIEGVKTFVDWLSGPHPLLELLQRQQQTTAQALNDITARAGAVNITAAIDAQAKAMLEAQQSAIRSAVTVVLATYVIRRGPGATAQRS